MPDKDPQKSLAFFSGEVLNALSEGVFTVDRQWRITSFNRSAEDITGIEAGEAIGRLCYEVFRADICMSTCALKRAIETGRDVAHHNVKIRRNDGRLIPISVNASVLHDGSGEIIGGVETFKDTSVLAGLCREISFCGVTLDAIADGAFTVDTEWRITSFNRAAEKITGMSRNAAIGKKCHEVMRATLCGTSCALKKSIETGRDVVSHDVFIRNVRNAVVPISVSTSVLRNEQGEIVGGVETFRDISDMADLRAEISMGDHILDSIADGAFTVDKEYRITFFNRAAEDITGVHRRDAIGRKCHEVFRANICQAACALKKSLETGRDVISHKAYLRDIDEDTVPVSISTSALRNEKGEIVGGVETFRDISTLEALRKEVSLGDVILDSIADGAFTVDREFRITSFNRAAEDITGVHRRDAIGKKCHEVFRADICQGDGCALKQSLESGRDVANFRVYILDAEDDLVPISVNTSALRNEEGEIIGGVETFRDISTLEALRKEISEAYNFHDIISKNHKIKSIFAILPDVARSGSTVLIEGPSGSGKELFAKAIHSLSKREGRYVTLNCAALPDTLLESELFGYEKGAFTDAKADKPGRFALAEKGTIFLDEIGDISPSLQLKLLRVLQEKEYEPLGSTVTRKADVRVIAATNKDLKSRVAEGRFRDDLFYRLNVIRVSLPPLTERREDIPLLVGHFIKKFNTLKHKEIKSVSQEVLSILMRHDYPGNIRELENIIEYCFVLCHDEVVGVECLPDGLARLNPKKNGQEEAQAGGRPLSHAEANTILEALRKFQGNRGKCAAYLGIEKTTLWRKMKKYNITFPAEGR
ncbi:sigma 54-interacting transcriptional regulator [Thiovibrio sp. JS02]